MAGRRGERPWAIWSDDLGPLPEEEGMLGPLPSPLCLESLISQVAHGPSCALPNPTRPHPTQMPGCRGRWQFPVAALGWPVVSGSSLCGLSRLSHKQSCLSLGGMMAFPEQ